MKKALIVVNPHSGEDQADDFAQKLQDILRDRFEEITIKETKKQEADPEYRKRTGFRFNRTY